jgi:hypothetical protein
MFVNTLSLAKFNDKITFKKENINYKMSMTQLTLGLTLLNNSLTSI